MHTSLERFPKNTAALTVTLEPLEVRPFLETAAQRLSKTKPVPGFRPGHAPFHVMAKALGADVMFHEAVEDIVQATYGKAVAEQHLKTIGPPTIELLKIADDNPFVYKATVALLPNVELPDLAKVKTERRTATVNEEDVDKVLAELQRSRATEIAATRPTQNGDAVELDFQGLLDGVPVEGAKAMKQKVLLGAGHFVLGFEEGILGMSSGQTKEFDVRFPDVYHAKHLAGRTVRFRATVHAVFQVALPALDDTFAASVAHGATLTELRKNVRDNVMKEKESAERDRYERTLLECLTDASTVDEIPDSVIDREVEKMFHELEHSVRERGLDFLQYLTSIQKTQDDLKKEFRPQAKRRLKTTLVIRAVASSQNINVSDAEVEKEITEMKKLYDGDEDVQKNIQNPDYAAYLKNTMTTRRVIEWLSTSP